PWMVLAYVAAATVLVLRGASMALRTVGRIRIKLRTRALLPFVAGTVPLFGLTIMVALYLSVDSVMLGYMQPYSEVARYEAGSKILEASQFMIRPLTLVLFPICAQYAAHRRWGKLRWTFRWATAGGIALGVLICGVVQVLGDPLIRVVYTDRYASSAEVLRILFWASPAIYVATVASFLAASIHHDRLALAAVVTGTALNIGLNLLLIPDMGAVGAAWATVAAQSTNALLLVLVVTFGIRTSRNEEPEPQR
ncbi:MAG: oligosaccharide flippase family protein, partial [Gemmatimonadetes bacterium]|nr:oligosaccharide flippase family protein [Gemmatimonadota bacterium]